jgi:hypothetical protein
MTVEYSSGYKEAAAKRLKELEKSMSPRAWAVALDLAEDFKKCTTYPDVSVTGDGSRHPESTKN